MNDVTKEFLKKVELDTLLPSGQWCSKRWSRRGGAAALDPDLTLNCDKEGTDLIQESVREFASSLVLTIVDDRHALHVENTRRKKHLIDAEDVREVVLKHPKFLNFAFVDSTPECMVRGRFPLGDAERLAEGCLKSVEDDRALHVRHSRNDVGLYRLKEHIEHSVLARRSGTPSASEMTYFDQGNLVLPSDKEMKLDGRQTSAAAKKKRQKTTPAVEEDAFEAAMQQGQSRLWGIDLKQSTLGRAAESSFPSELVVAEKRAAAVAGDDEDDDSALRFLAETLHPDS